MINYYKFTLKISNMVILITMIIISIFSLNCVAQNNISVDVTLKGIKVGQKVPDVNITGLQNYKDANRKPATSAKLSDFKGKLLILDFWATWCSPCIAMIPKMDSLQKAFGDKVQFLSVTYQTEKEVLPFLEKFEKQKDKHYDLPVVTDDKELHKLFPHVYLPHYVWIDSNGIVQAITGYEQISATNLKNMLMGDFGLTKKQDFRINYDKNFPFLINGNGGSGENLLYHSILTNYTEGLSPEYSYTPMKIDSSRRIHASNLNLVQLFRYAYGGDSDYFANNKIIIDVKDTTKLVFYGKGAPYLNWLRDDKGFCYELIVPPYLSKDVFKIMREDLNKFFPQYQVGVQKKKVKCLVLKRTSNIDKIKSSGQNSVKEVTGFKFNVRNGTLQTLITRLNVLYMQNSKYPIVNGTNYIGKIDMEINAQLSNISEVNRELAKYDLKFEVDDYVTDVLVIEDKKN